MRMEFCTLRPRQALRQASAVEWAVQRQRPEEDRCRSRLDTDQVPNTGLPCHTCASPLVCLASNAVVDS